MPGETSDAALISTSTACSFPIKLIELGVNAADRPERDVAENDNDPERAPLLNKVRVKLLFKPGANSLVVGFRAISKLPPREVLLLEVVAKVVLLVVLPEVDTRVVLLLLDCFCWFPRNVGSVAIVIPANATTPTSRMAMMKFFMLYELPPST